MTSQSTRMRECPELHVRCITQMNSDRLQHWKQEHGYILDRADHVAIERQPITGLQCIQAFLFSTWREKAFMVHPRTLHKYMGCGILDYDGRKRYMEQNAAATCKALGVDWEKCTARFARSHDVADALAIAMFALSERGGGLGLRKSISSICTCASFQCQAVAAI